MKKLMESILGDKVRTENQRTNLKDGLAFVGGQEFRTSVKEYISSMSEMIDEANEHLSKPSPTTGETLSAIQKSKIIDQVIDLAGKQLSFGSDNKD